MPNDLSDSAHRDTIALTVRAFTMQRLHTGIDDYKCIYLVRTANERHRWLVLSFFES